MDIYYFSGTHWDRANPLEHLPTLCPALRRYPGRRFQDHKHIRRDIHIFVMI